MSNYYIYILGCENDYLYIGLTVSIVKKIAEHKNGFCQNTKNRGKISLGLY